MSAAKTTGEGKKISYGPRGGEIFIEYKDWKNRLREHEDKRKERTNVTQRKETERREVKELVEAGVDIEGLSGKGRKVKESRFRQWVWRGEGRGKIKNMLGGGRGVCRGGEMYWVFILKESRNQVLGERMIKVSSWSSLNLGPSA